MAFLFLPHYNSSLTLKYFISSISKFLVISDSNNFRLYLQKLTFDAFGQTGTFVSFLPLLFRFHFL